MKFLAHVHKAPPEHNAGAEWMLLAIAQDLVRRGHEFTIYARHNVRPANLGGVAIHPVTSPRRLEALYMQADVVFTHLDETRAAMSYAGRTGRPLVHLVHNDRQLRFHGVTEADLVVFNSRWIELAERWRGPSVVVRPPVFADQYATTRGEHVTLINLAEAKGGPLFFELAERLPNISFLGVAGAYGVQAIPALRPRNVEIIRNTPNPVRDIYARTRLLLVPSSYESWGRVAIEAASSGIPVIAHPTPGLIESLGAAGIFIDRDDVDAWAERIDTLLNLPAYYALHSAKVARRARDLDPTAELDELERALLAIKATPRQHRIDFAASAPAYLDHLEPIYRAMPEEHRGGFYLSKELAAERDDLNPIVFEGDLPGGREVVVASFADLSAAGRRRVILSEHGAGQSYSGRHASYAGGNGRDDVALFLMPNDHAAARNRRQYTKTPTVVVGSPKVDHLATLPAPTGPLVAAISFHWRCAIAPEADTAFDHYRDALSDTRAALEWAGVTLIGHGHPGIFEEIAPIYEAAGIEAVASFEEVVRRAHVYAVDNSSTLFEFAALDRPVVVLNCPGYRRAVNHGLRFWWGADVGVQVDDPSELVPGILAALEDPPARQASRRAVVEAVYPVRDGSAARLAVEAILEVSGKACLVCGTRDHACGPKTDVIPVDQVIEREKVPGKLKRYNTPDGGVLALSDDQAKRMGLLGEEYRPTRPEVVSSSTVTGVVAPDHPPGTLAPGGVTQRARRRRKAEEDEADGKKVDGAPNDKKRAAPGGTK